MFHPSGHPDPSTTNLRAARHGTRRQFLVVVAAAVLVGSLAASGTVIAAPKSAGQLASVPDVGGNKGSQDEAQNVPSESYLEAKAHENDVTNFAPGDRVTVPYKPRSGDKWTVDGQAPRQLAAGKLSGADILRGAGNGSQTDASGVDSQQDYAGGSGYAVPGPVDPALASPMTQAGQIVMSDAASSLRRQVIGFLPYWKLGLSSTVLNYDALSTVAYFGVGSDSSGNLIQSDGGWSGWNSSAMTSVINAAHSKGTRVVLTIEVFAWSSAEASTQTALLSSSTARQNLANRLAQQVANRGADGINVDFEPIASGQGSNFTAFIRSLRAALDALKPGCEISIDVNGYVGNYQPANLVAAGAADAIFLMGYDFRGAGSNPTGSISPLKSAKVYDLSDAVAAFLAQIPPSKLILGLPWYGRAWSTGTVNYLNAPNMDGTTYGYSSTPTYATAKEFAQQYGRRYDSAENTAWTTYQGMYGSALTWRELYYDDAQSLGAKYDFVNQMQLRGSGIWCLGNDGYMDGGSVVRYPDLWQPIIDKFITDTTPPDAGIVNLAQGQPQEGFTVSWRGQDGLGAVANYDVQVSVDGGGWGAWLTGTTATSATYLGKSGHGYAFRVRATDTSGNVGTWDVTSTYSSSPTLGPGGFGTVLTDGLNIRKGAGLSYDLDGTLMSGQVVSIVGGPQVADGYTWYQIAGPISEWSPVGDLTESGWVAAAGSQQWVAARQAPNATYVGSAITGYSVTGTAASSSGLRTLLPIPGAAPTNTTVSWTLSGNATSVSLYIYRRDGSMIGSIGLGPEGPGAHSYVWDGTLSGTAVSAGTYIVLVQAVINAYNYYEPAPAPFGADVWSAYGLQLTSTGRWYGPDRYSAVAAASSNVYSPGVPLVFVATGENYPDALTGGAAAGTLHAPILLVTSSSIPAATIAELNRLRPANIVVLGGPVSIPDAVFLALMPYASVSTSRWTGVDRYDAAATISRNTHPGGASMVIITVGTNYPDALASASAAAKVGAPLLLTQTNALPAATVNELVRLKPTGIAVVGGPVSVSDGVLSALRQYAPNVWRWSGADRVSCAVTLSQNVFSPGVPVVFLTTSNNWPDGVSGGAVGGKLGAPVLLVDPTVGLTSGLRNELARLQPGRIVVLGGQVSVPDWILAQAAAYPVGK